MSMHADNKTAESDNPNESAAKRGMTLFPFVAFDGATSPLILCAPSITRQLRAATRSASWHRSQVMDAIGLDIDAGQQSFFFVFDSQVTTVRNHTGKRLFALGNAAVAIHDNVVVTRSRGERRSPLRAR